MSYESMPMYKCKNKIILNSTLLMFFLVAMLFVNAIYAADFDLSIKKDAEVDALIESHDLANAEKLAREKKLDARIIATIMALAGKKDEAITTYIDYLVNVPENAREEFAMQALNLASGASPSIGDALFSEILKRGIVNQESRRVQCHSILTLIKAGDLEAAEKKLNVLLSSPQNVSTDIKYAAIPLIARLSMIDKKEKADEIAQLLYKRFPDDPDITTQKISSQIDSDPRGCLLELDKLKQNEPEFYSSNEDFLEFLKAKSFANLGENERAKTLFKKLLESNSGMEEAVKASLNTITRKEDQINAEKKRWNDKFAQPSTELTNQSSFRFWAILVINAVFIMAIIYRIYRKRALS